MSKHRVVKIYNNSSFIGLVLIIFVHIVLELSWLFFNILTVSIWFVLSCRLNWIIAESSALRKLFPCTFFPKHVFPNLNFVIQKHPNFWLFSAGECQSPPGDQETCALSVILPDLSGGLEYLTNLHETDLEGKLIITNHL